MSLINDALKKAQRLRTEDSTGTMPPMPGGAAGPRVSKRSQPRTSQQLVILAVAALGVVVLTVVATVWLINRPAAPKPLPPAVAAPPPKPVTEPSAQVLISPALKPAPAPVAEAPAPKPAEAPKPPIVSPAPIVTPRSESAAAANPAPPPSSPPPAPLPAPKQTAGETAAPPVVSTPPAAVATAPAAEPKDDARVNAFLDAIHVTGIRSSGEDSRVLMNDRVFRVNDLVDRGLGVRLTKVNPNSLTFTDANGAVYVKNF